MYSSLRALRDQASTILTPLTTAILPLAPGQLSIHDFIASGDHLATTTSFSWAPLAAVTTRVSTLPPDKQFLYATIFPSPCATESPLICESSSAAFSVISDPSILSSSSYSSSPPSSSPITLSLCYDHYWRTPRVFFSSPHHTHMEILDIFITPSMSGDTATVETHPHTVEMSPCISLHPCKHASIMASLMAERVGGAGVEGSIEGGAGGVPAPPFDMHNYLPLFLKSIAFAFPAVGAL